MVVKQVSVENSQGHPDPMRRQYESELQNSPADHENLWTNQERDLILDQSPFEEHETAELERLSKDNRGPQNMALKMENPFEPSEVTIEKTEVDAEEVSRCDACSRELNAFAPRLTAEEKRKLREFDPRWWIEHLDINRGRSIQLAYLDKSSLGEGMDKLLMSAIVASWVFYFPRDFNLLAEDALQPWENRELEHIGYLTATHFAGVIALEHCERYATGRVAMLLDATARLLGEHSAPMQQQPGPTPFAQRTAWSDRGLPPSVLGEHGRNTGFHGR